MSNKVYGNHKQYCEFYKWCYDNNVEALLHFQLWDTDDKYEHLIASFPDETCIWMRVNCDLEWVVNQINGQSWKNYR